MDVFQVSLNRCVQRANCGVGVVALPGELAPLVFALVELLDERQVLVHLVRHRHHQLVRLASPRAVVEDLDVHYLGRVELALAAHLLLELGVQVLGHLQVLEHALELVHEVGRHAALLRARDHHTWPCGMAMWRECEWRVETRRRGARERTRKYCTMSSSLSLSADVSHIRRRPRAER